MQAIISSSNKKKSKKSPLSLKIKAYFLWRRKPTLATLELTYDP